MNNYKAKSYSHLFLELSRYIDRQIGENGLHSKRVARWAIVTARELDGDCAWLRAICWGALLHDIGKIAIPGRILSKRESLTRDEWRLMKMHPTTGANMISFMPQLASIAPSIYYHQERYDGSGYPEGLRGEGIPLAARILSVADAYDAMTSDRCYRKAPGHQYAIRELQLKRGQQFDPQVVDTFIEIANNGFKQEKSQPQTIVSFSN